MTVVYNVTVMSVTLQISKAGVVDDDDDNGIVDDDDDDNNDDDDDNDNNDDDDADDDDDDDGQLAWQFVVKQSNISDGKGIWQ